MNILIRSAAGIAAALVVAGLSGCILIRTTEHRITLRPDGSGEAVLRLIDIRTDAMTDSLARRDCQVMISSFQTEGMKDFEEKGRTVTGKRFFVSGDTLVAEIAYSFSSLEGIEGLHVIHDALYLVVNQSREVVRTNGRVEPWQESSMRIVWKRDAQRLLFQIREKNLPVSMSLARIYEELQ